MGTEQLDVKKYLITNCLAFYYYVDRRASIDCGLPLNLLMLTSPVLNAHEFGTTIANKYDITLNFEW